MGNITQIKDFISKNQTADALSVLLDATKDNQVVHDSVLLISSKFTELKVQRVRGTISNEEAIRLQNQINENILDTLSLFDNNGKILPGIAIKKKRTAISWLFLSTVVLVILGGIFFVLGAIFNILRFLEGAIIVTLLLSFFTFIALLLALIVSAAKGN
jgi:hypothetical protein